MVFQMVAEYLGGYEKEGKKDNGEKYVCYKGQFFQKGQPPFEMSISKDTFDCCAERLEYLFDIDVYRFDNKSFYKANMVKAL